MEINNKLFLSFIKEATLQVWPEVISPSEAATFATSAKTGELWDCPPTALAMSEDEIDQFLVFLSCPRPFLHTKLVTTRLPYHNFFVVIRYTIDNRVSTSKTFFCCTQHSQQQLKPHAPTYIYKWALAPFLVGNIEIDYYYYSP